MLTEKEVEIIEALASVYNMYLALPVQYTRKPAEFAQGIHYLQEKVMSRSAVREHPEIFTQSKENTQ